MEFKVSELEREPIEFDLELAPGAVDFGEEAAQGPLATAGLVEVLHEHRGPRDIVADIRLRGRFAGNFEVPCARCVEPVEIPLGAEFDLIFRPAGQTRGAGTVDYCAGDGNRLLSKGQSLLEDVLREQVLLSLPAKTLCKPDCKGLCPRCGVNRNIQPCNCEEGPSDPRWEAHWLGSKAGSSPERFSPRRPQDQLRVFREAGRLSRGFARGDCSEAGRGRRDERNCCHA
jgi:uncharacterized protein